MKKILILILVLSLLKMPGVYNVKGETLIKIDQEHFPGPVLRYHVCKYYDKNHDGFLSKSEIKAVKKYEFDYFEIYTHMWMLTINEAGEKNYEWPNPEYTKYYHNHQRVYLHNFKGIEIFYNLEYVKLHHSHGNNQIEIKNLKSLYKLKNLKYLWIENTKKTSYDFRKLKKLKTLKLDNCYIKKIKFNKKQKVEKLTAHWSKGEINLSKLSKLKSFCSGWSSIKKVTFGKKNKKVKKVEIYTDSDIKNKMKKIDLSKLKNLKKLCICNLDYLKKVYLPKKNKIKGKTSDNIINCDRLKRKNIIYK